MTKGPTKTPGILCASGCYHIAGLELYQSRVLPHLPLRTADGIVNNAYQVYGQILIMSVI
jgi:hypothetical protein